MNTRRNLTFSLFFSGLFATSCLSDAPTGIEAAPSARTTVKLDFFHKPLPELPLPNDIATRYDATSPTGRRINASMIAETGFEVRTRELIDTLDGWGVFMPIAVPFTGPLDIASIQKGHPKDDHDFADDVIYLVNVDPESTGFGAFQRLDVGGGNYPVVLEEMDRYWQNDPRGNTNSLIFEETEEDLNKNEKLDPGEDTDADGVLDHPNYLPGKSPAKDDLAGRADALMSFYERETHTLIARPMVPLAEQTTYAVVIMRRLLDEGGQPVGSPYPFKNHEAQTTALAPLADALATENQSIADVAFAFTFTTQSIEAPWKAVRDGLYGHGIQAHLATEYPAEVLGMEPMLDITSPSFIERENPYLMHHEDWSTAFSLIAAEFLNAEPDSVGLEKLEFGHKFIDFHAVGYFDSPQLFERRDKDGKLLGLNDQSWPADLDRVPVKARRERVYFHLAVPRRDISLGGKDKPAPVVILGHGYGGNRFDAVQMGGYFARHGMAVLSIDSVSHGIDIGPDERKQAEDILGLFGLTPALEAMTMRSRASDQNGDERVDSGADFWTAYLFHTRDVVRQSALDYMQLVRVVKSFDGKRRGLLDLNRDGETEIAGDFDGDGILDIGGDAPIYMFGASLGGIMAAVVGALEPGVEAVVPIAAGGGLGDVALRSIQGGVPEAVILRMLGPIFLGTQAVDSKDFVIETLIPNLNSKSFVTLGSVQGVEAGDFIVIEDDTAKTRACGYVADDAGTLRFRTGLEADQGDTIRFLFYRGDTMKLGSRECEVQAGAKPRVVVDSFTHDTSFQDRIWRAGLPLVTFAEGPGLGRATPDLRRFLGLTQLVLDACDPAVMVPFMRTSPITYEGTGQTTGTNMLLVTTAGDMNVPASTGVTIARAAGLVDFETPHPVYKTSLNQVLLDTHTTEAVNTLKRYTDSKGNGIIKDIENFSEGKDLWGSEIPRLDPPLRLGFDKADKLKSPGHNERGISAAIFPFPVPDGQHGFAFPGTFIDTFRKNCKDACPAGDDCKCGEIDAADHFDVGSFLFNMMARYVATGGKELTADPCFSRDDCSFLKDPPEPRSEFLE